MDEGRNVMEVGKISGLNFGPNENAILHISQIEKEEKELHQDKKTRGDVVDQTA